MLTHLTVPRWSDACAMVADVLLSAPSGVFTFDRVCVPGAAHQRSLTQAIASAPAGPHICAGVTFSTIDDLVADAVFDDHMWSLPWLKSAVAAVLHEHRDDPAYTLVAKYLGDASENPGRRTALATQAARLLSRYISHAPFLLENWLNSTDVDVHGHALDKANAWQAQLWRDIVDTAGHDPVSTIHDFTTSLANPSNDVSLGQIGNLIVVGVNTLAPCLEMFLEAASAKHDVHVVTLAGARVTAQSSMFARHHAHRREDTAPLASSSPVEGSLLQRMQHAIYAGTAPKRSDPDPSFVIHACHDKDRQVEVLREVLCDLFDDDPSLQPRNVTVLCPSLEDYAPMLHAVFLSTDDDPDPHPGTTLRLQVSRAASQATNDVIDVLLTIFDLYSARATSADLLRLCAMPAIARRFGFGDDSLDDVAQLIDRAHIAWGVNDDQRMRSGVDFSQSTWLHGVARLLVSLALDTHPPVLLGCITPLDGVEFSDSNLIGALAEFVSRIDVAFAEFHTAACADEWVQRLRRIIDTLCDDGSDTRGDLVSAYRLIDRLAVGMPGAMLDAADVRFWLADQMSRQRGRSNYGTGDLIVTGLGDAQGIDAEVVIILGLTDDDKEHADGVHDLLARNDHLHYTADPVARRQQSILDAVLSARQRLIVITQGYDARNGAPLPAPLACHELLELANATDYAAPWLEQSPLVVTHSVDPWDASECESTPYHPGSFDPRIARASSLTSLPSDQPKWSMTFGEPVFESAVALDDLVAFYRDPAKQLLSHAAGVDLRDFAVELTDSLPIEIDGLTRYNVRLPMVTNALDGIDDDVNLEIARHSGLVLDHPRDERLITDQMRTATNIASRVKPLYTDPERFESSIDVDGVTLHGQVTLHKGVYVRHVPRWAKFSDLLELWIQLLWMSASQQITQPVAILVAVKDNHRLDAPAPNQSREILSGLLSLRSVGLSHSLPLKPEWTGAWANLATFTRNMKPYNRIRDVFRDEDDRNWLYFYPGISELYAEPPHSSDPAQTHTSRFESLASWLTAPLGAHYRAYSGRP